jgi:pyruvate,water dikinase
MIDPVDQTDCRPDVFWTTGNVAEAFPGVCTPLGFSFMHEPVELALRRSFFDIGAFTKDDLRVPPRIEDQFWTVFAGRAAANLDSFTKLADRLPGTSATATEQQLFGSVRPTTVDNNTLRRYPAIMAKAPRAVITLGKRHDAYVAELRAWRVASLARLPVLDEQGWHDVLGDARHRLHDVMVLHFLATFVSSGIADKLGELARTVDRPGLEARLLSGVGSDENEVAADLFELAHGRLDMATFGDRHGYHGPNEGQLDVVSWREDPSSIEARLEAFRAIDDRSPKAPRNRARAQEAARDAALAELLTLIPKRKARSAKLLVRLAGRFIALREQGKAGFLITFDVARAAARRIGTTLPRPDDVFFHTWDELASRVAVDPEVLAERRQQYAERARYRLPEGWEGMPKLVPVNDAAQAAAAGTRIEGVAASGGIIEGRARVVTDPGTVELDDGDILVCEATDPSWVALFMVAGGVVTDLGGLLSHGAIVAREMGIPCVVGTKTVTQTITDGQPIRVNGDTGLVEVLA